MNEWKRGTFRSLLLKYGMNENKGQEVNTRNVPVGGRERSQSSAVRITNIRSEKFCKI